MSLYSFPRDWTPASLSGLALWLTAGPTWCFSDAAGTVPCADGDSVRVWRDQAAGILVSQATSGNRPTLRLDAGGKWYVLFDGVDDYVTAETTPPVPTQPTLAVAVQPSGHYGVTISCHNGFNSSGSIAIRSSPTVTQLYAYLTSDSSINYNASFSDVVIEGTILNSTNGEQLCTGGVVRTQRTPVSAYGGNGTVRIGVDAYNNTTGQYAGRVYGVVISSAINAATRPLLTTYLTGLLP